ncbi:MAG: hypothetical protein H6835_09780 [Planctomycetes bacterium]|nr:hypothetical protein [Planctomycetota bacterium]
MMQNLLIAALVFSLADASRPPLALLPHPSAFRMANEARAVVEGTLQADGSVAVTVRHFVGEGVQVADTIRVRGLAEMPLTEGLWGMVGKPAPPIEPDAVLLFLEACGDDGRWSAVHHHGDAARGVVWLVGDAAFGYAQVMNPGPYVLGAWTGRLEGDAYGEMTCADVRAEVAAGVVARATWRATMAVEDADRRAKALVAWLSPQTSPDGAHFRERFGDVMAAAEALGEHLVSPLARVVQSDASADAVGLAAYLVTRLGERAAAAAPSLIARLRDPRGCDPRQLLSALRALRDPRARDVLRDRVLDPDPFVAASAAQALFACGDHGAAELLAARVPGMIFSATEVQGLAALLEALHDLDAAQAEQLLRERFLEWEELTGRRDWTRRVRDEAKAAGGR